ncbi:MAG: SPOR domain-containing protein [Alphaproteobacteria bacterium]|nr:SPOR domain-containing protein [Alphaproteobacteria bacterium]
MSALSPVPLRDDLDPPPEYLRQGPATVPAPPAEARSNWGRAGIILSLVTLSAFGGGVWFAYQQGVREGQTLAPPLVRADTSPTRIVPVEPGGMVVANQDKRVFDTMALADLGPRVEQLLPPPETPMAPPIAEPRVVAPLTPLPPTTVATAAPVADVVPTPVPDAPVVALTPRAEAPNGVPVPPRAAVPEAAPADGRPLALLPPETPMAPPIVAPRVVAPLTPLPPTTVATAAPVADVVPTPVPDAPVVALTPRAEAPNGVPVPPRAAVPEAAPADGRPLALLPPAATPAPAAVAPRPATTTATATPPTAAGAAGGTFRIQLGSYGDAKAAMDNWDVLKRKYATILTGMQPTVIAATVQGRTYHRLQAGPLGTVAAANDMCARVKAGGTDCLVVRP